MDRLFVVLGAIFMFLGVAAGAMGAHALSAHFERSPELAATYETAVRYHLIHGLAMLAAAWASTRWPGALVNIAAYLFAAGIVLFSGSLYLLSLTGARWFGAITPVGGAAFLAGWLALALAVARGYHALQNGTEVAKALWLVLRFLCALCVSAVNHTGN